ncbi:unnamed protein product [Calicophoron daubneyi]|uniref:NECAP PHear domain-containing protein n=1 Tax=Calicophoron daubneyi TaxID=300641 RepID=A0AAV2TB15_CALDB
MEYENVLLVKNEVFVYRIPPRQSNRGYRAADWGLDSPCWTGRLRVVVKGKDLTIKLEDRNTGELFAACPVDAYPGIAVEPVLDSSRYFVIRLVADDGRTTFTGIGFSERSDSFDLNVAIQDHFKWLKQEQDAEEANKNMASRPSLDLGFKEGEKIKLNLNTRRTGDEPSSGATATRPKPAIRSGNNPVGLLPPPPAPSVSRTRGNRTVGQHITPVVAVPKDNPGSLTDVPSVQPTAQATSCCASGSSNVDLLADIFGTGK